MLLALGVLCATANVVGVIPLPHQENFAISAEPDGSDPSTWGPHHDEDVKTVGMPGSDHAAAEPKKYYQGGISEPDVDPRITSPKGRRGKIIFPVAKKRVQRNPILTDFEIFKYKKDLNQRLENVKKALGQNKDLIAKVHAAHIQNVGDFHNFVTESLTVVQQARVYKAIKQAQAAAKNMSAKLDAYLQKVSPAVKTEAEKLPIDKSTLHSVGNVHLLGQDKTSLDRRDRDRKIL